MIGAKVMDRTMKRKEEATDTIKVLKKTRVRLLSGIKIVEYPNQYPNIGTISKKLIIDGVEASASSLESIIKAGGSVKEAEAQKEEN